MPKFHDVVQGSTAWLKIRAGIPTASDFDRILTPTGKLSTASEGYMLELLAERLMGRPTDRVKTEWIERGNELEATAVEYYELAYDCEAVTVGFVTNDPGTYGCSPDRLVGDAGLLEIKAPSAGVHIQYLLFDDHKRKYYPQLQGQLLVTERQHVDIVSYHPEMPTAVVRVERDEDYIAKLAHALEIFCEDLADKWAEVQSRFPVEPQAEPRELLSDADVDMILAARSSQ